MVFPKIWLRSQSLDSIANGCPSPAPLPIWSWSKTKNLQSLLWPYLRSVDCRHTHTNSPASASYSMGAFQPERGGTRN